jgi:HTH-type transcriptional regulator / antitoxin HigA
MGSYTVYAPECADFVTAPGDTLLEMLKERGMTQTELAQRMGRPIKTINGIIKGHKALTPETALQLEKVFSVPASFWLAREHDYREFLARQAENKDLQAHQSWVERFPIAKMQALDWIPSGQSSGQLLVDLLHFFGLAHPDSWRDVWQDCLVDYRKTRVFDNDDFSLSVWLRQGEIKAQEIFTAPFDQAGFTDLLQGEIRTLTRTHPTHFRPALVKACAEVGVAVVVVPQVDGAQVSGAARWLAKDKALIQLSLRYKTNDHFWFSFFHQASHILKHGKKQIFIETESPEIEDLAIEQPQNGAENNNHREEEADQFAADLLIKPADYAAFVQQGKPYSRASVVEFAERIGITPGIVVGRLQHDNELPFTHLNQFKEKFEWVEEIN